MKVMIDIPKEFETDLQDKFNEFFERLIEDINCALDNDEPLLCGNYEKETAEMFLKAFEKATIISDDATNKDVLIAMFQPGAIFYDNLFGYGYVYSSSARCNENYMMTYSKKWGNAPYKKGTEE